jgi:prepilin-type N-terminal cleavage/methylation domain-containing protein
MDKHRAHANLARRWWLSISHTSGCGSRRPRFYTIGRRDGFTIVEMLVVIAIIAILMGLLLPSIGSVQKRSRKLNEINQIRQVGMAWQMYANQNNDAALPGYLSPTQSPMNVIERWRVRYEYPMPPNPSASSDPTIPHDVAAPWTWRLAEFIDYNAEILWGYRRDAVNDVFSLVGAAEEVAITPAFGYNGYYVGGWWEVVNDPDPEVGSVPRFSFHDATADGRRVNVVARSVSSIARPAQLITFCSSTRHSEVATYPSTQDDIAGAHLVAPPTLGNNLRWYVPMPGGGGGGGDTVQFTGDANTVITVAPNTYAPIARHNNFAAVLLADGSTSTETMGALNDQRRWIDRVDDRNFTHTGTLFEE